MHKFTTALLATAAIVIMPAAGQGQAPAAAGSAPQAGVTTPGERANTDLLKRWYRSATDGTPADTRLAMLDPDIEFVLAAGLPRSTGGTYRGVRDMRDRMWPALGVVFDEWNQEEQAYFADGDTVILTGTYHIRSKGNARRVDAPFVHVWTFRDGRPVRLVQHTDTALIARAVEAGPGGPPPAALRP